MLVRSLLSIGCGIGCALFLGMYVFAANVASFADPDCTEIATEGFVFIDAGTNKSDLYYAECFNGDMLQTIGNPTVWSPVDDIVAEFMPDSGEHSTLPRYYEWKGDVLSFVSEGNSEIVSTTIAKTASVQDTGVGVRITTAGFVAFMILLLGCILFVRKRKECGKCSAE